MRTGLFVALVVASTISSTAEAVPLEGTVQLVDPAARRLSITRNTADGDKTLSLDVSPKAGNLSSLKTGDRVTLDYDPEQEVVTKIGSEDNGTGAPGQSKAEVAINMIAPDSLKGWHLDTPVQEANWVVANGVLICTSKGPHLVSDAAFDDFEMTLEFLLPPRCNSGIFLRNRYEIQFLDSMWRTPDNKPAKPHQITGAIWDYVAPSRDAYLGPNQWNRLDARLVGDEITVRLNNKKIIDNQPLNRKRGANEDEAVAALGPFLLQYHTNTEGMKIRNFVVRPLRDVAMIKSAVAASFVGKWRGQDDQLIRTINANKTFVEQRPNGDLHCTGTWTFLPENAGIEIVTDHGFTIRLTEIDQDRIKRKTQRTDTIDQRKWTGVGGVLDRMK